MWVCMKKINFAKWNKYLPLGQPNNALNYYRLAAFDSAWNFNLLNFYRFIPFSRSDLAMIHTVEMAISHVCQMEWYAQRHSYRLPNKLKSMHSKSLKWNETHQLDHIRSIAISHLTYAERTLSAGAPLSHTTHTRTLGVDECIARNAFRNCAHVVILWWTDFLFSFFLSLSLFNFFRGSLAVCTFRASHTRYGLRRVQFARMDRWLVQNNKNYYWCWKCVLISICDCITVQTQYGTECAHCPAPIIVDERQPNEQIGSLPAQKVYCYEFFSLFFFSFDSDSDVRWPPSTDYYYYCCCCACINLLGSGIELNILNLW